MEQIIMMISEHTRELFLMGMTFLLLFQLITLQKMKKVSRQLKANEKKMESYLDRLLKEGTLKEQMNMEGKNSAITNFSEEEQEQSAKDSPETLIDAVLAEVFS